MGKHQHYNQGWTRMKTIKCDDAAHKKLALIAALNGTSMCLEAERAINAYYANHEGTLPAVEERKAS